MLRKQIKEIRNAMPELLRQQKSFYISKLTLDLEVFYTNKDEIKKVFVYLPFGSEFDTSFLIKMFRQKGMVVFVPRVNKLTNKMDIVRYDKGCKMVVSDYGIPEPSEEYPSVTSDVLDLVIVPGLAFSPDMDRLGYGGGYYDKLFSEPGFRALKIAPCFEEQILERLPQEEHDSKMDIIVCDKAIYHFDK